MGAPFMTRRSPCPLDLSLQSFMRRSSRLIFLNFIYFLISSRFIYFYLFIPPLHFNTFTAFLAAHIHVTRI